MCAPSAPKAPPPTPQRAATVLPNNGDPSIRANERAKRRSGWSSTAVMQAATLGMPSTSNALGVTGNG